MKYKHVFLLGRPGCGKSALYRELERRILESSPAHTVERVDDFPKVWAALQRDDALDQEGKERIFSRRTAEGGYFLTDVGVFDDILREVNADVLSIDRPYHTIFVEFARPSYVEALQHFDSSILDSCLVIYMEVDFETCWARNVARHEIDLAQEGDDHMVSRDAMEALYLHDDQDALVRHLEARNIPVVVVNNEADGEEHLRVQVDALFGRLF